MESRCPHRAMAREQTRKSGGGGLIEFTILLGLGSVVGVGLVVEA